MAAQFSNTYTSMQCKDNTTIVFDEVCYCFKIANKNSCMNVVHLLFLNFDGNFRVVILFLVYVVIYCVINIICKNFNLTIYYKAI